MRALRTVRRSADLWFHIKTILQFYIYPPPLARGDSAVALGDGERYFRAQPSKIGAGRAQSKMMPEGLQRRSALARSSEDASICVQSPDFVPPQNTIWHAAADLQRAAKMKGQFG